MQHTADPSAPPVRQPPTFDTLPVPVFFRLEAIAQHATFPTLRHPWGEFIYSFSGVTEIRVGRDNLLAPPHLGLWIPPGTQHTCFNAGQVNYCSLYIRRGLCTAMPAETSALLVTPLVRTLLEHLRDTPPPERQQPEHKRLLHVLVDQLSTCKATGSFMPHTDDPELGAILRALRRNPADNRSLAELAAAFHIGERTLMRRCKTELGMSLSQWRQRLRLVTALPLLRDGHSVESVALGLGYATSSAFIAMFRRLTGSSPAHFTQHDQSNKRAAPPAPRYR